MARGQGIRSSAASALAPRRRTAPGPLAAELAALPADIKLVRAPDGVVSITVDEPLNEEWDLEGDGWEQWDLAPDGSWSYRDRRYSYYCLMDEDAELDPNLFAAQPRTLDQLPERVRALAPLAARVAKSAPGALTQTPEQQRLARALALERAQPGWGEISEPEQLAIASYVQSAELMNSSLRGTPISPGMEEFAVKEISALKQLIGRTSLGAPLTLYRGIGDASVLLKAEQAETLESLVGTTLDDPAFLSTSVEPSGAMAWAYDQDGGGVMIQIEAPAGAQALLTTPYLQGQQTATVQEVILPPGSKLLVEGVDQLPVEDFLGKKELSVLRARLVPGDPA